jgi:protein-export membrane protein SecD
VRHNLKLRFALIAALLVAAVWYLLPSLRLYSMSAAERQELSARDPTALQALKEKAIKLGLDLQGGMHLVLEIDESESALSDSDRRKAIEQILEVIRNRVNQFGVAEPLIQKVGDERIIVELPGIDDEERAKSLVQQAAYLEFQLVREGREATALVRRLDAALRAARASDETPAAPRDTLGSPPGGAGADSGAELDPSEGEAWVGPDTTAAQQGDTVGSQPQDTAGGEAAALESLIQGDIQSDTSGAAPESAAAGEGAGRRPEADTFSSAIQVDPGGTGDLLVREDLVPAVKGWLDLPSVEAAVPAEAEILWSSERRTFSDGETYQLLYVVDRKPLMTGESIATANAGYDTQFQNRPIVSLTMTGEGRRLFGRITGAHVNDRLAIVLDGVVRMAPNIIQRIPDGRAQITGFDSTEEANVIAIVLQAGALEAPIRIIEERTVGPSLGADSVEAGRRAFLLGSAAVLLFMFVYYRLSGAVANLALVLNVFLLLAVLAAIDATLTLPGIAGVILTVGMAVDANVLIFERVREELDLGRTVRSAIDAGYEKALRTIVDSNVTTLIVGVVLLQFGTGPVKGFGITLCIGILISMFTAIFVTRTIYEAYLRNRTVERLSI